MPERERFASAIQKFQSNQSNRAISHLKKTVDPDFPCHTLSIPDPQGVIHPVIVQRPFATPSSPFGRTTRAYLGLDVSRDKLVFVKDYWRPTDPATSPEMDVYEDMKRRGVPHLPHVLLGGDVPDDGEGFQSTLAQNWGIRDEDGVKAALKGYRHHRIVQDIAFSLSSVANSRELVMAIRNAIECESDLRLIGVYAY